MSNFALHRLTAFSDHPAGGNPAGVWIGEYLPTDETMQAIAADVGYSETVFAVPAGEARWHVRYFSPEAEVPFCGHATIALGAQLGTEMGNGRYELRTSVGIVPVDVRLVDGLAYATLTSVDSTTSDPPAGLVEQTLALLGWAHDDLARSSSPVIAYAGARHLILESSSRERLANVDYDFAGMKSLMLDHDLTTVDLVWRESSLVFHARNLFPVGGVVEDPATGAAAAALGGYLRDAEKISIPSTFVIHQGVDMGRPSLLTVEVPSSGGIKVSGTAVMIE